MKKGIVKTIAAALAVFGATLFARAEVATGSIYSIDLVDDALYGGTIPTERDPLLIGQKAVIRVRLLNSNFADPDRAKGTNPRPWSFEPRDAAMSEKLLATMNPKLGLVLGGQPVYADLIEVKDDVTSPAATYTDIYFEYVVKSGDLAMPAHLMSANGQPAGSTISADYALLNMNLWKLTNVDGDEAVFHFYNGGLTPDPIPGQPQNLCVSGLGMGLFIKTVDFDKNYAKEAETTEEKPIWRQIYRGMVTTTIYGLPTVAVEGQAESATTLYVWVDKGAGDVTIAEPLATDGAREVTDKDNEGREVSKRIVLPVSVAKGVSTVPFKLKGLVNGKATVKMSSTEKLVFDDMNQLVTNWVERVVQVIDPPDPFVALDLQEYPSGKTLPKSTFTLTADYENPAAMMTITLSQDPSADLTVKLEPTLDDGDIFADGLLGISETTEGSPWLGDNLTFTFKPGGALSKTLYIYGKGTTPKLSSSGVKFTVNTSGASEYDPESGKHYANLIVKYMNPLVVKPTKDDKIENAMAGASYPLDLTLSDARKWMLEGSDGTSNYEFFYKVAIVGDDSPTWVSDTFSLDDADTGTATVSIPFDIDGEGTLSLYVVSPSTKKSATVTIPVKVAAPKKAWATLDREDGAYAEGETAKVKFSISQKYKSALYAFLVPLDDDARNKYLTTASSEYAGGIGCYIAPGDTTSKDYAEVQVLDGKASGQFEVFMCTQKTYDKKKSGGYVAGVLTINATNVVPRVNYAEMGGQTVKVNGGAIAKPIAQGVEKTFRVNVEEPGVLDLSATGTDQFLTQWKFGTGDWEDMKGDPATATIKHTFTSPGTHEVTVRCQDKDMRALNKWSAEFSFRVTVLDIPKVVITPVQDTKTYYEDQTGSDYGFKVSLTTAPDLSDSTKRLNVALSVTDLSTGATASTALIELSKYAVTYASGVSEGQSFFLSSLDGTAKSAAKGYRITAHVTNASEDVEGKTWDDGEIEIYIVNRAPQILNPVEKLDKDGKPIATTTTIGTDNALTWAIKDVEADEKKMAVTWETSEGQRFTYRQGTGPASETEKYVDDVMSGTHTFKFTSAGEKSITMTVQDKDGESVSRTFYYTISPSKTLKLIPHGPTAGKGTPLSKRYRAASGVGEGRVYAANLASLESFESTYNCGLSKSWTIYAYGYKAGETSGHVGKYSKRETPMDADGNADAAGGYVYGDAERDSFLYSWIQVYRQGGDGGDSGSVFVDAYLNGATAPEYAELADVGADIALPTEADEDGTYDDTIIEAVFSKEFLPTDNLGDINQDGVPDIFVDKFGMGVVDTSGKVTGDDLESLLGYNGDEDYLPSTETSRYASFIPGLPADWVTVGRPFGARLEIRGYHDGLNDAAAEKFPDGVQNVAGYVQGVKPARVYLDPELCPTSTLSKVEYLAFVEQGGLTNDVSTWSAWSPERPTDPTKADTDEDGFTDGYEYYFWYRAHVGYLENEGTAYERHRYMTGRRYDPYRPAATNVITSAEIAALFDPAVSSGEKSDAAVRDTDNDGLPDLLEFELGTNPVDCDTDGDGLPDGYEVLVSGTDPLKWATDDSTCDADLNPDGDWMANEPVKEQTVFGLDDGNGGIEYYSCGKGEPGTLVTNKLAKPVTFLYLRGADGGRFTNFWYATTEAVLCREVTSPTNGFRLTKALTSKGTWRCCNQEVGAETNKFDVCLEPVNLPVDWAFMEKEEDKEAYVRRYVIENDTLRYWEVWTYGRLLTKDADPEKCSNLVYGREYNHAKLQQLGSRAVRAVLTKKTVHRLHYHVYQESGYDPRVAWKGTGAVKTTALTHLDEFYTFAFFQHDGVLAAADIVPTRSVPWDDLWKRYSTSPTSADTDVDSMPDGWELYLMSGPKKYVEKKESPNFGERVYEYGPLTIYSPLYDFNLVADNTMRDNDTDTLDWQAEYVGSESGKAYPNCETITAYYEPWAEKGWRNKKWPTDPWNLDTDGDGLTDGEEAKYFIYGSAAATVMAGGGLDPLSWDTDNDGLPDPWEAEFQGSYTAGASTATSTTSVSEDGSSTNKSETVSTAEGTWDGGMNGTVSDAFLDYDQDGLDNWQEYMTGAMRCWRYDDTVSPWTNLEDPAIPKPGTDAWDEFWYAVLVDEQDPLYNPHLVGGVYDNGASWFSQCTNAWDGAKGKWYMFKDGVYHDLRLPPERYIVTVGEEKITYNRFTWRANETATKRGAEPNFWIGIDPDHRVYPLNYICCDPRNYDSDNDGLDDYYELFHGMNPLLGEEEKAFGSPLPPLDLVYKGYGGGGDEFVPPIWSAKNNYWTQFSNEGRLAHSKPRTKTGMMDFEIFPWLNGLGAADPDGDNIRNQQEGIFANLQAASSYLHTDPTPLWMTDTSYANSLTRRYFRDPYRMALMLSGPEGFKHIDPNTGVTNVYKFADFPLFSYDEKKELITIDEYSLNLDFWHVMSYFYSFEENEGYDSDHDYLSDFEEGQGKTKPASDPQNTDSPLRRQAMYFGGEKSPSFLQTPVPAHEQVPYADVAAEYRQNFLYYTVECWAKPEDVAADKGLQTLVERVIQTGEANPADEKYTRRNFLIGLKNGRWYTRFDSTGTDANQPVEITDGPQATTNWTHVAATYDGTALRLYVDGLCNNSKETTIQPEHGVAALTVSDTSELSTHVSYTMLSVLVGASAGGYQGVVMDYNPRVNPFADPNNFTHYNCYYKGYIDEVRIWDGARPASDLRADVQNRVRYNAALAEENRQVVFASWRQGARRSPVSKAQLPAQLMYHFSFDHLPGAVRVSDVLRSPAGFVTAESVTDAKAIWSRPKGWVSPWWAYTLCDIHSKVYAKDKADWAWVPWIGNTVAHLSRFDGTTLDSVYWSDQYAGRTSAADAGYDNFAFPCNHEVYSKWTQMTYNTTKGPWSMHSHKDFLDVLAASNDTVLAEYTFAMRDRMTEGGDLLPMGSAFPKRISAAEGGMWDDQGAADAWAQTGRDTDNNSLPDWWQAYARANYCPGLDPMAKLGWDTTVTYGGLQMPAWQAYLRDLAAGMLPGGKSYSEYADTRDFDKDGMPDWWEELNSIQTFSQADADADPDNDGLSNYAEYLLGEVYPLPYEKGGLGLSDLAGFKQPKLDPQHAYSSVGQRVVDYFQSYSTNFVLVTNAVTKKHFYLNEYFGEIATDHDFMEDWWENAFESSYTSSKVYDPLDDKDEDGWSNWAECRASLWGGYFNAELIDGWTGSQSSDHVVNYPEPVIGVKATYHGLQDISGHQLVIRVTSGQTARTDATFVIPPTLDSQTRYIGPFKGDFALHGHLSPGQLNVNSVVFSRAKNDMDKTFFWTWTWYDEQQISHPLVTSGSFDTYRYYYARYPMIELTGGDLKWESFAIVVETSPGVGDVMFVNGTKIGTISAVTGEYEIDVSKLDGDSSTYVYSATYTSRIGHEWPQTVYVSDTKELASGTGTGLVGNGRVREGRNTVEAFMDMNANGTFDEGEPFGVARNVQVGWHKVPEIVIELKDDSPIMPNVVIAEQASTTKTTGGEALTKKVRVVRTQINDKSAERVLVTKTVVQDDKTYLTEADVCTAAKPDLDWTWLVKDAEKLAIDTIETASYRVEEVVKMSDGSVSNTLIKSFIKEFPSVRPTATAVEPVNGAPVYSASPKLSFSVSDAKATGYRLQIRAVGAGTTNTYDSGITVLPARTGSTVGSAVCEVTPAVFADAPVYAGTTTNHLVFADGMNYQWRVALFDAKYNKTTDDGDSSLEWSVWADFAMDVRNEERYPKLATGYGCATVAVRYYGPATNDLTTGAIVVEAFENADFRGQPVAQVRITNVVDLASLTDVSTTNAVLRGLKVGTLFLRAYIDQNNNGSRDDWESWGYANMVGQGFTAIYNPDPFVVTASTADGLVGNKADRVIYIEDTDFNKNEIPDCLEEFSDPDPVEPIDWWEWAEADPDDFTPGDVMAYYETTMKLVTLWDGADKSVLKSYLLDEGQPTPVAGNAATGYVFWTSYEYGALYGLGTVVTNDLSGLRVYETPKDVKVALVHAQVREKFGFCADTAVPQGKTNTKAFTAQDKYYVLRYLEQTGRLNEKVPEGSKCKSFEDYVMKSGNTALYEKYTLKPNVVDNDHDGIADGWELYVDSKPLDASDRENDDDGDGVPLWGEYDLDPDTGLAYATDPRSLDTDGDTVSDYFYHIYHLWDPAGDKDKDGLSNNSEYLCAEVFGFGPSDPDKYATNDGVCDYFKKVGDLYRGEIFQDHDQVDDAWERAYATAANMYVYDPSRDDDNDGWSNWAESKAGTNPGLTESPTVDGTLPEYPIPAIRAKVSYNGNKTLTAPLKFMAWNQKTDAAMLGSADAVWTAGGDTSASNTVKYLGKNPGTACSYYLGTGTVTPGSLKVYFRDVACEKVELRNGQEVSSIVSTDTARWFYFIRDVATDGSNGELYTVLSTNSPTANATSPVKVGTVDYTTGLVTIDFAKLPSEVYEAYLNGEGGGNVEEKSQGVYYTAIKSNLDRSYVRLSWKAAKINTSGNATYYLSDCDGISATCKGHLREGLTTFYCWSDEDGSGTYTPGEPFGVVRDVDVGWQGASFEVELTETTGITPRLSLTGAGNDRDVTIQGQLAALLGDRTIATINSVVLKTTNATDRAAIIAQLKFAISNRVQTVYAEKNKVKVRVVRYGIDDKFCYSAGVYDSKPFGEGFNERVVMEKEFDIRTRDYINEADFLTNGVYDIDWGTMTGEIVDINGHPIKGVASASCSVTNVTYLVVIGDGAKDFRGTQDTNTIVYAAGAVTRRFEKEKSSPKAENVNAICYASRPTFRWSMPNESEWAKRFGSTYTAFKLKIFAEDGVTKIYDSGIRRAPAQDANGVFSWTAEASVSDLLSTKKIFAKTGNYTWQVAMYNAKFLANEEYWGEEYKEYAAELWQKDKPSALAKFSVAVNAQQEMNDHQYSSIDVAVKYAGPANVIANYRDLDTLNGKVRVQAFATADFAGAPLSETIVTTDVDAFASTVANVRLRGLDATGTYYVRAYIDSNGNHKRDEWESWGAAKEPVVLTTANVTAPLTAVWIEDCDVDQDWLPDAWEYVKFGEIAAVGADVMKEEKTLFSTETKDAAKTRLASISTGLEGASLTIFENGSWARTLLGLSGTSSVSFDDIRAAVRKELDIKADTFKITSLTLGPDGKVTLAVDAEVAPTIAGRLLSSVYDVTPGSTKTVKLQVYKKTSLAVAGWGDPVKTATVELGAGAKEVSVDVGIKPEDLKSGFYKIDIVE